MDCLWVCNVVLRGLVIQQIEEIFHGHGNRLTGAQNHSEQIVYELLQCPLKHTVNTCEAVLHLPLLPVDCDCVRYLHRQQAREVDLRDRLGSLTLFVSQTAPSVLG